MIIVNRMVSAMSQLPENRQIKLMAERRLFLKRRWRGSAEDGTEFGFDLEDRLISGCVIHQTADVDYVICQEPEHVFEIPFESSQQAALVGWKIGNLHFPVEITPTSVRTPNDPAIRQLIEREGWTLNEVNVLFNPLRVVPHVS
jgi:urease accessory protein